LYQSIFPVRGKSAHWILSNPLDPRVEEFWKTKVAEIYHFIPDLAGFILKATPKGVWVLRLTNAPTRMRQRDCAPAESS
jgi:hypothetical protein